MADIKTRQVNKGTIKSLDRASSMTHRMKDVAVRAKEKTVNDRRGEESSSSSFATEKMMRAVKRGAAVAGGTTENAVRRAYREYGAKKIRGESQKQKIIRRARVAEAEVEKEVKSLGIGRRNLQLRSSERIKGRNASAYNLKSPKPAKSRQQTFAVSQRDKRVQQFKQTKLVSEKRRVLANNAKTAGKGIKAAAVGTKTLISALIAVGSSAVLVIVICIFLSVSIYLFGQDTKDEYSAEALGVGDTLIMRVASAQLGNVGGLKFAKWYGFGGRVEWCACFVSWCANQCGYIDKGIIPKFALVGDGVDWFKARGRFQSNKYIPHPGDIIFFDWGSDGTRDHVGFVERCDGKMVYTIEGNSGDACKRLAYRVGHPEVLGYGVPAYPLPQSSKEAEKGDKETKENKQTTR